MGCTGSQEWGNEGVVRIDWHDCKVWYGIVFTTNTLRFALISIPVFLDHRGSRPLLADQKWAFPRVWAVEVWAERWA
jgi:hypothetical protein